MPFHLAFGLGWIEVAGIAVIVLICFFAHQISNARKESATGSLSKGLFDNFIVWLARGFNTGLLPKGPGTWGSLVGIVWTMVLVALGSIDWYVTYSVLGILAAVWICDRAEKILKQHDPSSVVLDEIIALPICFLPWVIFLWKPEKIMPPVSHFFSDSNWLGVLAIFGLFRLFDIRKPGPIGKIQKLPGGWGVTADDVLAGVATALVVTVYLALRHNA